MADDFRSHTESRKQGCLVHLARLRQKSDSVNRSRLSHGAPRRVLKGDGNNTTRERDLRAARGWIAKPFLTYHHRRRDRPGGMGSPRDN